MTVDAGGRTFTFSQKDGQLKGVKVGSRIISLANGPRFIAAKRSDRSMDSFITMMTKRLKRRKPNTLHLMMPVVLQALPCVKKAIT